MNHDIHLKLIPVWDLPVRIFHWTLVGLVIVLWITTEEKLCCYNMDLHMYCGYAVLTLVLFRLLWGFFGSQYARFGSFVWNMRPTLSYIQGLLQQQPSSYIGHNPLGSWSVILLLSFLLVQASTGLFASDDILIEGPLFNWVSESTSHFLTEVHEVSFNILLSLIILHVIAIFFYRFVKHENLILPMLTGYKQVPSHITTSVTPFVSIWRAILLLGIVAGIVYGLLSIAEH